MTRLRLWITGGGTREPLDAVRYVGNRSTGALATAITREALRRGHQVTAILASSVALDPEIAGSGGLEAVRFETASDLARVLVEHPAVPAPDAVIHAAAVADYAPEAQAEKVPSGRPEWTVVLRPLPKLAPRIRRRFPDCLLIVFKLERGVGRAELERRALAAARKSGANLVFANRLEDVGEEHAGVLLDVERGLVRECRGRDQVAAALCDVVETRRSSFGGGRES